MIEYPYRIGRGPTQRPVAFPVGHQGGKDKYAAGAKLREKSSLTKDQNPRFFLRDAPIFDRIRNHI